MKNRDVSITQQPPFLQELQKPTAAKKIACFLSIFSLLTPRNARLRRTFKFDPLAFYIRSGAENPSRSMQVSSTSRTRSSSAR